MNAITIKLPWAAAIRAGRKLIENRGRPIHARHIGTRVAIHAGAGWSKDGAADGRILDWWWGPDRNRHKILDATDFSYMFRNIIAVATVADCHEAAWPLNDGLTCCQPWGERRYGPRGEPAWHIVLADVVALDERIGPIRGSLSVPWPLHDHVARRIEAAS